MGYGVMGDSSRSFFVYVCLFSSYYHCLVFFSVAIITFLYAGILAFGFLFLFQQLELGIFLVLRRHLI
jgi:hypothetical protein